MSHGDLELRIAWELHVGPSRPAFRWYESVVTRYREPHRHYHDVRHLRWVVRHLGELAATHRLADLSATVAAAFFHDVIYDPTAADNERSSAHLASTALTELGWADHRVADVATLIIGTIDHVVAADTTVDAAALYAADLGVLAADPAGYSDYVRNVRREYAHVSDQGWTTGRSTVLRSFLDRSAIYAPELGLHAWEQRARANLTAELDTLVG